MATEEQVRESLEAVLVPAAKRSIVGLNKQDPGSY